VSTAVAEPIERLAARRSEAHRPTAEVDDRLCWTTIIGLAVLHVGAAIGVVWLFVNHSWPTLVLAATLYVACGLSMTAGYHRLFSHRTYRASAPVRCTMLVFGAAGFQNSAISWAADHRAHHADTDGADDPHAITRGVGFAHVGWLFRRRVASADVRRLTDLWSLRSVRLQHRWYAVVAISTGLLLPTAIAWTWDDPWGGLFVAGFLRAVVMLQATFCINSLAHMIGTPRYDRRSTARDSLLTSLLTFGEGYHSFHHRFPFDYRGSVHWWQYDPNKWFIWSLARLRLIDTVRTASPATIQRALLPRSTDDARSSAALGGEDRRVEATGHGVAGRVGEAEVVPAGVPPEPVERLVDGQLLALGDHPLGLFDDDATGQCVGQLGVDLLRLDGGTVLQDGDGRHVGERLSDGDVVVVHRPRFAAEQVERPDDRPAQAHRDGVGGPETGPHGDRGESWPAAVGGGEVLVDHR
jgi:stearoyl-CoA desaturase (delta-9 desaturase)